MRISAILVAGWLSGLLWAGPAFAQVTVTSGPVYSGTVTSGPVYSASPIPVVASVPGGSTSQYYCQKCGKYHTRATPTSSVAQVSYPSGSPTVISSVPTPPSSTSPSSTSLRGGGGVRNVLSALNAQRSRQGIGSLRYDPSLQAVAERRAQKMASMGLKNHPPGSFAPGTYEGVGWSSSYSPAGVSACFTSDPRMQFAGAAMATGRDGVYFAVVYR